MAKTTLIVNSARTAESSSSALCCWRRLATRWSVASPNPEATMLPALIAAITVAQTP